MKSVLFILDKVLNIGKLLIDMQKKRCIIIHGCTSNAEKAMNPETRTYDKHWMPWIKKQLNARGIETQTPLMPEPWHPDYGKFKAEFEKHHIDENTILVGHSCGCALSRTTY